MGKQVKRSGGRFLTHKQGMHGFGLIRIDQTVKKYGGYINRKQEEGVFVTEILLPQSEIKE